MIAGKQENRADKTIAIVGGGVSGALVAFHLVQQRVSARVLVIDPRPRPGLGLAYSTPSFEHLLNVPAGKISALSSQPDHFLRWLQSNSDAQATEKTFAPRAVFGRYIQALLKQTPAVEHIQAGVVDYRPEHWGATLQLSDGRELRADLVVLATGNFAPAPLAGVSDDAMRSGAYRHDAWAADTFSGLDADAPMTLIGMGLTGVDVLLRLRELGHRGVVTAVSRHGLFPNRHADYTPVSRSAIASGTPATCLAYLRSLRAAIGSGVEWRAAVDSLRATTNDLWLALPDRERRRFRRHLQRRWEIVRHRMAPAVAEFVAGELAAGKLVVRAGRLASIDVAPGGANIRIRGTAGTEEIFASRVINCTGPGMDYRRVDSPLFQSLFAQGLVTAGDTGRGFDCAMDGALIGADGQPSTVLFNLGPGRLGNLFESIAVPEIRQQAMQLAESLAHRIDGARRHAYTSLLDAATSHTLSHELATAGTARQVERANAADMAKTAMWAVVLGVVSGAACVGLRLMFRGLQFLFVQSWALLPHAAAMLGPGRRVATPIVGALCATAIIFAARRWSRAPAAVEYVEAVRFDNGRIPLVASLWRTSASSFSIATGAAIGREGSMIQFAAAITSWVGARSPFKSIPLSRQVAYGVAAAVAAAYKAPIAGIFFASEIVLCEWSWIELPPLAVAAVAGWLVSRMVLGAAPLFMISGTLPLPVAVLWALPLAALLGLCAPLYQKFLRTARFTARWPLPLAWGGLAVGLLSLSRTEVWGNGDVALMNILQGHELLATVALVLGLRLIATTICVGAGTVGGVFTPTLFAGAAVGLASAHLLHSPAPIVLAIVGLGALLSAVTHAPLMATFMAVELTGQYRLLPALLLLNLMAWLIARKISSHTLYGIASPEPLSS